jgi:hypothetical protein
VSDVLEEPNYPIVERKMLRQCAVDQATPVVPSGRIGSSWTLRDDDFDLPWPGPSELKRAPRIIW